MEEISVVDLIDLLRFFSRLPGQIHSKEVHSELTMYYSHLRRTFMEGGERAQPTNHKGGQREREGEREAGRQVLVWSSHEQRDHVLISI